MEIRVRTGRNYRTPPVLNTPFASLTFGSYLFLRIYAKISNFESRHALFTNTRRQVVEVTFMIWTYGAYLTQQYFSERSIS